MTHVSGPEKWLGKLMRVVETLLGLAFLFAIALNFINVIGRYGLGRTLVWSEDVQVFVLLWMVFLGASVASCRNTHVRMDLLTRSLPATAQRVLSATEGLVTFVLFAFVAWVSRDYLERIIELDQTSAIAGLPMWIPHAAVSVSFGLMALVALVRGVALGSRVGRREAQPRQEA